MRRLCDEGVRSYLGRSRLVGESPTASRRWWRNSNRLLKTVLTIAYFDSLGVPRLS